MPKKRKNKVPRPRNAGEWTEAMYWGAIYNALRRGFRYWKPIMLAKNAAKRDYTGSNPRQKFEYKCNHCDNWFMGKEVEVDHVEPAGRLRCYEDIEHFLKRLLREDVEAYQVLCKPCHKIKTLKERKL